MFGAWQKESEKFQNGENSKEDYDTWRYYPSIETERCYGECIQGQAEEYVR